MHILNIILTPITAGAAATRRARVAGLVNIVVILRNLERVVIPLEGIEPFALGCSTPPQRYTVKPNECTQETSLASMHFDGTHNKVDA